MPGITYLPQLIRDELIQRREEGCDITGFEARITAAGEDEAALSLLYDELMSRPIKESFSYTEPNGYEEIRALSTLNTPAKPIDFASPATADKFEGAWLGRCCGCALGKPFEIAPFNSGTPDGKIGPYYIRRWYEANGEEALSNYAPSHSPIEEEFDFCRLIMPLSQRENIKFMETDDDVRYTVLSMLITERLGADFTPWNIGWFWHEYLTYNEVYTAEAAAYLNYVKFCLRHPKNDAEMEAAIHYIREYRNPYREWIGAQIRIDGYAYAAAGDPELAAKMAYSDAAFSHTKNGIYGAMYCAALIAAAFTEKDPMACIEAGLAQIPTTSRLYEAVKQTITITEKAASLEKLHEALWAAFGAYSPVHTINNAAACTASFLFSEGDFDTAIRAAVGSGWDSDCNGATVGSMAGALVGASGIPEKWKAPLHDTLYSNIPDFHPVAISACAKRSMDTARKLRG